MMIKSGRGRKIFRVPRAQLYLQPHHTKNPRSALVYIPMLSFLDVIMHF